MKMFSVKTYKSRRAKLMNKGLKGIGLIPGNTDSPMNYTANVFRFRQDSTFLYFFGIDLQNLFGIIDFESGEELIFGNEQDMDDIIWEGEVDSVKGLAEKAGVSKTMPFRKIGDVVAAALEMGRDVHYLPQYRAENKILFQEILNANATSVNDGASLELIKACVDIRSIKEPQELHEIEKACRIAYNMHVAAMLRANVGASEQEIAGVLEGIAVSGGGMPSFPIILSQRGAVLHNHDHSGLLKAGKMMLTDAGAESALHYASDFTRTTPVGRKFNQQQKNIYQIVLDANNAGREASMPGVKYLDVHLKAARVIASGLKVLGIMQGDTDEAVAVGAHALFFPHGLGHMMGLDVHDMEDYGQIHVGYDEETRPVDQFGTAFLRLGRKLKEGFVITDEPGIYFIPQLIQLWKAEKKNAEFINFSEVEKYLDFGGIRLEDDLVITSEGAEIIGKRVPITIEDIENLH